MKSQIIQSSKPTLLNKIGWAVMLLLAVYVALITSRYLTLDPEVYFPEQKAVYMAHITILIVHIVASILAILIGPFQFCLGSEKVACSSSTAGWAGPTCCAFYLAVSAVFTWRSWPMVGQSPAWALPHWLSSGCSADSGRTSTFATRKLNLIVSG